MEESEKDAPDVNPKRYVRSIAYVVFGALVIIGLTMWYLIAHPSGGFPGAYATLGVAIVAMGLLRIFKTAESSLDSRFQEAIARARVRNAEDALGKALRGEVYLTIADDAVITGQTLPVQGQESPSRETVAADRKDDRLTLAALWDLTHRRLDLYHTIVTRQARRSFWAAQAAMLVGFGLLVGFAIVASQAKTTTAAISTGSLGAVGAALAAYIGRTFIRSQETAATHLRAYFDQPLELSRYLAAERLLADAGDLTADQRAAILSTLVQAISTAGNGKQSTTNSRAKSPRSRARSGG